jgi:hypothetical protein
MARTMKRSIVAATLPMIILAGCSSGGGDATPKPSAQTRIDVSGKVLITNSQSRRDGDEAGTACFTSGNSTAFPEPSSLDDVKEGAQVVVSDASGKTVGIGALGGGTTTTAWSGTAGDFPDCQFTFTVPGVASGQSFYSIKVGDQSKQVSAAEIGSPTITLS